MKLLIINTPEKIESIFKKINEKEFGLDITIIREDLKEENEELLQGVTAVISSNTGKELFGDAFFARLHRYGISCFVTRSTGYNHIDLESAKRYGVKVANVPAYSPNAIADLTVTLALCLNRNIFHYAEALKKNTFFQYPVLSNEIRDLRIGIIGAGAIGRASYHMFKGMGADVVTFSRTQKEDLHPVSLEELIQTSDIICLHLPYIPGVNKHLINKETIAKMKDGAILINTARGELVDTRAVIEAIKSGKLKGFGTDVLEGEKELFNQSFKAIENPLFQELLSLYPRVMITPHMADQTIHAQDAMCEIALRNCIELEKGDCQNTLN